MEINQEQRQKLECMQIKGIRRMIWKYINKEDIESRLLSIRGQKSIDNMKNFVNSQSRATLIKLIENSPEIIPSVIDEAYEKYRYGLKPGFTLFWAKRNDGRTVTKEDLEESLKQYLSEVDFEDDSKYKGLECTAITQFDDIYEISLSFLQRFNYINSDGEFTFIYMMKECFVWVGVNYNFIAINSMPDILMNMLKQFFSNLYHADITNIKITNTLLKTVFSTVCTKRITRHNANPPENQLEKVTFADRELSKKIDFIPSGYENYDVTNTQYIEEFEPISKRVLSYSFNELSKEVYKLKEKCAHSTIENCQLCKHNRCNSVSDIGCLLKLFDGFEGFTMQPHQGHEFGDVSMVVTLDDCSQTFLGVAKTGKKKITKSSDVGREIIEQVLSAFCDTRTEIIGVIYPGMIDDQLKHLLYHEAKVHNKRLVIMDNEFMIKLFDYYIEKHGIMISN